MDEIDFRELWKLTDDEGKPIGNQDNALIKSRIELAEAMKADIEKQIQFLKAFKTIDKEL